MSFIKRTAHRIRKALKPPFYLKRQTYVVRYQVTVRNTGTKPNELTIAVPMPSARENQTIVSAPRFTPAAERVDSDKQYGNQFAVWNAKLAPGESRLFTQYVTVAVSPMKKKLPPTAFRSEYVNKAEIFCVAIDHLAVHDEQIIGLMKEAAAGAEDVGTLVSRFNEFVMKRLEYGNPIDGLYSAQEALSHVKVDCGGFDALFSALCIAAGIPARIVSGFWAGYPKNDMHAWAEVQMPSGEWIPVDPSRELLGRQDRTRKMGKLGEIGSDRIAFSVGCDIPLQMLKKVKRVDILQHPYIEATLGEKSFALTTTVETSKA